MIGKSGVKIKSVWKCVKCGRVQRYYGSGYPPKKCYVSSCHGTMKRKA